MDAQSTVTESIGYHYSPAGPRSLERLIEQLAAQRAAGQRIVTTNGCFDLLHQGHVDFLAQAKALGDCLVVGLNSDQSVRQLKGATRPLRQVEERANILLALRSVDHVVVFHELLPNNLLALLQPDFHCKAGEYTVDSLPETDIVRRHGGEVRILSVTAGVSTSHLIQKIVHDASDNSTTPEQPATGQIDAIASYLLDSSNLYRRMAYQLIQPIESAVAQMDQAIRAGQKILVCGNGGSAADAQHFAAELMVRFKRTRCALPAIALTTDTSILTAAANDFGYEQVFARQIEGLGTDGDILLAISTSGESPSVLRAAETARKQGLLVIGLTKESPSTLSRLAGLTLGVSSEEVAQIQQGHLAIIHLLCDLLEQRWAKSVVQENDPSL